MTPYAPKISRRKRARGCDFAWRQFSRPLDRKAPVLRTLHLTLLLMLIAAPAYAQAAPTLAWDTVTTDSTGAALGAGQQVTSYEIYRCPTSVNPCTKALGTKIGSVPAASPVVPRQTFNLAGQAFPATFCVTATNIIAESLESVTVKATPADKPKNPALQ